MGEAELPSGASFAQVEWLSAKRRRCGSAIARSRERTMGVAHGTRFARVAQERSAPAVSSRGCLQKVGSPTHEEVAPLALPENFLQRSRRSRRNEAANHLKSYTFQRRHKVHSFKLSGSACCAPRALCHDTDDGSALAHRDFGPIPPVRAAPRCPWHAGGRCSSSDDRVADQWSCGRR